MKRRKLKSLARQLAAEWESRSCEELEQLEYPFTEEKQIDGFEVNVEVCLLERNCEYIQLGVIVDDGRLLSTMFPAGTSAVVYRRQQQEKNTP